MTSLVAEAPKDAQVPLVLRRAVRSHRGQKSCVGIFWAIQRSFGVVQLVILTCSLKDAELYGDMLTSPHGHYDVWNEWQSKGHPDASLRAVIAASEYEEWPRGRIVFDTKSERFTLYADMQILKRPPLLSDIRELFKLPKRRTEAKPDSHYRSTRKLLG